MHRGLCYSFPMPRTKNANVPRIKASNEEVNVHRLNGSIADVERNGKVGRRPLWCDSVDFRSYNPQLFNHRVKLPGTSKRREGRRTRLAPPASFFMQDE